MLRAALNKLWKEHLKNEELYKRIPMVTETIRKQYMRIVGDMDIVGEPITNRQALYYSGNLNTVNGHVGTYIDQLVEDTACSLDELPNAMNDRDEWRKRVNDHSNAEQARPGNVRY